MTRRVLNAAVAGAVAFGVGAAPMLAAPYAVADERPIVGACRQVTSPALLQDDGEPVSLTVQKTAGNPYDDSNGKPLGSIQGIEFDLYKVEGLDLSTTQGLAAAQKLTVDQARGKGVVLVGRRVTRADGTAMFGGLTPGMYLVEETAPDNEHNYRTSAPFLVLLPTVDANCKTVNDETTVVVKGRGGSDEGTPLTTTSTRPSTPGTDTETTTPGTPGTSTVRTTPPTPPTGTTVTETDSSRVPPTGSTVTTTQRFSGSGSDGPGDSATRNVFRDGPLASTGANVIWALFVGLALIIGGVLLVRRSREEKSE
mgnify:CR=1 FL=1